MKRQSLVLFLLGTCAIGFSAASIQQMESLNTQEEIASEITEGNQLDQQDEKEAEPAEEKKAD